MPTTTYPPTNKVARRLKAWREQAELTIDDLAYLVRAELPRPEAVSRELLRRYEGGLVAPERMSTLVLMTVAKVCRASLSDLGEPFAENAAKLTALVRTGSRCTDELAREHSYSMAS